MGKLTLCIIGNRKVPHRDRTNSLRRVTRYPTIESACKRDAWCGEGALSDSMWPGTPTRSVRSAMDALWYHTFQ